LGISGAYQASAQKLNQKGDIVTLEGAESLASLARKNFHSLGLDNARVVTGRFQDTLDRVLIEYEPIDYAFIDGHHDEEATITYFQQILPHISEKSILIFDNISWSKGMRRAWKKIQEHEKVKISLDMRTWGICVLDEDIRKKISFQIPLL
jgi:predicted O-methyltransferase YrrM